MEAEEETEAEATGEDTEDTEDQDLVTELLEVHRLQQDSIL